jgi:methyl-accepting chemotaxis protein
MAEPVHMPAPRRGVHLNLRWKIMLTIVFVAVGVVAVGAIQTFVATRLEGRGRFLRKHYNRFDEYRKGLGQALGTVASFVALDPTLRASLGTGDLEQAAEVFRRAARAANTTVDPELVVLLNARGEQIPVRGTPDLGERELARSRLVSDVLGGMTIVSELALIDDTVFQVSAAPVRTADGAITGGVILGQRVERFMRDYQLQSDPNETKQHRLTLVGPQGRVLASVFSEEKYADLAAGIDADAWTMEQEGDEKVPVIHFAGGMWDFWSAPAQGYAGSSYGDVGTFFLMRTRDFKQVELQGQLAESGWVFLVALIVALLIGYLLSIAITRRIDKYVAATEDLARGQGDLTRRLEVRGHDELGRLAENLNAVFGYIHELAARVQRSAFQVGASSAEISAASKQMLEGAQEQARKTEGSTAAITELSASIQQVAENAMEATRVARSSGEAVQAAIERMNDIRHTVEEAATRIGELGESGKRIGNIVEVIRQISDQTTLLALNAAIEAAHAGEQGRGFAVVADEVSGLAKRVGQSARDIEDLIATIKEQTVDAVRAMEAGTREVEVGTTLVANTLNDLRTLIGVVEDTAKAVQEQAVASDEIARNMDVVQRIAQDVLGSSEEAVAQGDHLHRLAHGLEESVKGFKIDPNLASSSEPGTHPALPPGER